MDSQLNNLGLAIDAAFANADISALKALIEKCDKTLEGKEIKKRAIIFFFKANCYGYLASFQVSDIDYTWSWQQNDKIQELLCLRNAESDPDFSNLDLILQCKILTNLGNNLNQFGRFIAAIKAWESALSLIPNFAMALGNKGVALIAYAHSLYDYGHAHILIAQAFNDLKKSISIGALWDGGLDPKAEDYFRENFNYAKAYLEEIKFDFGFDLDQWGIGENKKEIEYRLWCLEKNLFLSPLNDACKKSVSARDILHLPSHRYNINEDPRFSNYYNILKQEYVTARFMLFQSFDFEKEHISDTDVLLLDGFDGVQFGYRNEQLKTSYRLVYSLFDKVALFLNEYYEVGLKAHHVNFKKIWGKTNNKKITLYSPFHGSKNWPLRGLYYLSKDLFDRDFVDVALPEAKELARLRNYIEHKYVSLQDEVLQIKNTEIHLYITIEDFQLKTLRMMSMAREALIYLSLAMLREEAIRNNEDEGLYITKQAMAINRSNK